MNRRIISNTILFLLIMGLILSCGKDDDGVTNLTETTNVYVVGY